MDSTLLPKRAHWTYRPDLDGLRAIAISLVVFEHYVIQSFHWIRGGLGVDMFFVLSGYLITSIILNDHAQGTFSFLGFYARRVRRLFPLLMVTLLLTLIGAWFWVGHALLPWIGENIAYASVGLINLPFSLGVPAFQTHPRFVPLAQLWSLALEEQFYFVLPWVLVSLLKIKRWKPWALTVCGMTLVASWSYHHAFYTRIGQTYYNPWARSWELLVGVCLALWLYRQDPERTHLIQRHISQTILHATVWLMMSCGWLTLLSDMQGDESSVWMGMGLIMAGWIGRRRLISWAHPTPSLTSRSGDILSIAGSTLWVTALGMVPLSAYPLTFAALPLTVGTALVIMAGPQSWLNRMVLSRPLLVTIGRLSYAIYLVHYPIYSLEAWRTQNLPSAWADILMMVMLTGGLAWSLHRWVEQPARHGRHILPWIMGVLLMGLAGYSLWQYPSITSWLS